MVLVAVAQQGLVADMPRAVVVEDTSPVGDQQKVAVVLHLVDPGRIASHRKAVVVLVVPAVAEVVVVLRFPLFRSISMKPFAVAVPHLYSNLV